MSLPRIKQKCSAKQKWTGNPCQNPAIRGGKVCRMHGGGTPQVKAAARERLAALVDPAITRMGSLVKHRQPFVALAASRDILDRNGYKPTLTVQADTKITVVVEYVGAPTVVELPARTNGVDHA